MTRGYKVTPPFPQRKGESRGGGGDSLVTTTPMGQTNSEHCYLRTNELLARGWLQSARRFEAEYKMPDRVMQCNVLLVASSNKKSQASLNHRIFPWGQIGGLLRNIWEYIYNWITVASTTMVREY